MKSCRRRESEQGVGGGGGGGGVNTADRSHPSPNSGSRPPASSGVRSVKAAMGRAKDQEVRPCLQNKSMSASIKFG